MAVEKETLISDCDWSETVRPIIRISPCLKYASLYVGGNKSLLDNPRLILERPMKHELVDILNGYAELFAAAAEFVKSEPEPCVPSEP